MIRKILNTQEDENDISEVIEQDQICKGTRKRKGRERMDIKTILFDLDGTLTDSGEGIMNAVRYTLERYEKTATEAQMRSFIGPPSRRSSNSF